MRIYVENNVLWLSIVHRPRSDILALYFFGCYLFQCIACYVRVHRRKPLIFMSFQFDFFISVFRGHFSTPLIISYSNLYPYRHIFANLLKPVIFERYEINIVINHLTIDYRYVVILFLSGTAY